MAEKIPKKLGLVEDKNAARNRALLTGAGILGAVIAAHHFWPKGILYGDADDSYSPKKKVTTVTETKVRGKERDGERGVSRDSSRRPLPSQYSDGAGGYSSEKKGYYPPRSRSGKYFYDDNDDEEDDEVRPPRRRSRSAVRPTSYYEGSQGTSSLKANPNPNYIPPPTYVEEAVYTRPHHRNEDSSEKEFYDELASARQRARPRSYAPAAPPPAVPPPPPITRTVKSKGFYEDEGYGSGSVSGSGYGSGGSVAGSRGYAGGSRRGSVDYDADYGSGNGYRRLTRRDSNRYRIENGWDR